MDARVAIISGTVFAGVLVAGAFASPIGPALGDDSDSNRQDAALSAGGQPEQPGLLVAYDDDDDDDDRYEHDDDDRHDDHDDHDDRDDDHDDDEDDD
jgi:hypothetical protein